MSNHIWISNFQQFLPTNPFHFFNGFKVLFGIKETEMGLTGTVSIGFARFVMFLMLLAPLCLIAAGSEKVKVASLEKVKEKLPFILCCVCAILALLYMISLGKADLWVSAHGESVKVGSVDAKIGVGVFLNFVLGLAGAAVAYLTNKK